MPGLTTIVFWLAVGVFGDVGPQTSPLFETERECLEAVAYAKAKPEALGVSGCYKIEVPIKQSKT